MGTRTWSGEIAEWIRRRIGEGELKPGDRVPSIRTIATQWRVAHATATKALAILRAEGLVEAIPGAYTMVAGGPARSGRGNSRERIALAAIEIADEVGLDAVSMRAVAARLDVATMSLYHHVKGRSELVTLMAKTASTAIAPVDPGLRGRSRLESAARSLWTAYRRYPWLTRFDLGASRALSWQEGGPVSPFHHHVLVYALVRGLAADLFGGGPASGAPGCFEGAGEDLVNDADGLFDLGLRGLLDGLSDGDPQEL